jgi:putative CocE/NonD family hydrolase
MNNLAPPRYSVTVEKAVMMPMRDGTRLAADLYRPEADGRFPALVERTPYNREESVILRTRTPQFFAERGFVVVVQDVRGRFGSEGSWYPFIDDGSGRNRDGYDTIQWVASQPWCNGKVATTGGSYSGQTQMLLAPTRPPALVCGFVREAASDLARQWCYRGGAFEWGFNLDWCMRHGIPSLRRQADQLAKVAGIAADRFDMLPLGQSPLLADTFGWLRDILAHPEDGSFWRPFNFERVYDQIEVPIYHMAGWFDIFLDGSLRNFMGLAEGARSNAARKAQKLIIGPWTHGPTVHDPEFARYVGDMDFGESAVLDFNAEMLRWYDFWLNGVATGVMDEPPVRFFLMGANEWRSADRWPPPNTTKRRFYLRGGHSGSAHSLNDGRLTNDPPERDEDPDRYIYDPAKPVPTVGGNTLYCGPRRGGSGEENPDFAATAGPRDQRSVEPLCLTYSSGPLATPLDVVGSVRLTLFASSNGPDTDFTAKLCDVFPDGRSILVADGILRCRYRKSRIKPRPMKKGKVYPMTVDLWPTAWRFGVGHRLRVAVTSSNFPRFDRNLNTGKDPIDSAEMRVAENAVYHDDERPSHLIVRVLG